jgi:hypothetical protein
MKKALKILVEFVAALVALWIIIVAGGAWLIAARSVEPTDVTPYVESAIHFFMPDNQIKIGHATTAWDNRAHTLLLSLDDTSVEDAQDGFSASLPKASLALNIFDLMRGRFVPQELLVEHLSMTVQTGGGETRGAQKSRFGSLLQQTAMEEILKGLLADLTNKTLSHTLKFDDFHVLIHDQKTGREIELQAPEIALDHRANTLDGSGDLKVRDQGNESNLSLRSSYSSETRQHTLTLALDRLNPTFLSFIDADLFQDFKFDLPISGTLTARFDRDLTLQAVESKLETGSGAITAPRFWDQERAVKQIAVDAVYDRPNKLLSIPSILFDFGGPVLALKGEAHPPSGNAIGNPDGPKDMNFTLEIGLTNLPMDAFASVWPKPIITNARAWIAANMSKGQFTQGNVALQGRFDWNDLGNLAVDSGSGKVVASGGRVKYIDGMPPLENVNAEAPFDLNGMDVHILSGGLGAIKLQPTVIKLTDFEKTTQNAEIPVKISGSIRDVLKLIDYPPLGYAKAVGLNPDEADGKLDGTVTLRFPLLNDLAMKDIEIKAEAKLADLALPKLIPGLDIAHGNMDLAVDKNGYELKGPADLNKIPLQIVWNGSFGDNPAKPAAQGTVSGTLDTPQLALLSSDLADKIKGPVNLSLRYTQPQKGAAQLAGDINLRQAKIAFDEANWQKQAGVQASLQFTADLPKGKPIQVKTIDFQSANARVKGMATLDPKTFFLQMLDLHPFVLGRSNANIHFEQTPGPDGAVSFVVDGEALDVSGVKSEKDPSKIDRRAKKYSIKLGKYYASENGYLASLYALAQRDKTGWQEIDLHGFADGAHPVDIVMKKQPDSENRSLYIASDDFGALLKGFGLTEVVKGGALEVHGESIPGHPETIEGKVKIGSFVAGGLPVLVRLVSAVSPFGFADLITGDTSFDQMSGKFRWNGDDLEFIKVRASGTSYGLNINGHIDLNSGVANLHGTLVPFSFVNGLLGVIPMIGNVITGGEGQGVIAASYDLKGDLDDPQVSVNPVSLLAPGFLRNLFFGGDEAEEKE